MDTSGRKGHSSTYSKTVTTYCTRRFPLLLQPFNATLMIAIFKNLNLIYKIRYAESLKKSSVFVQSGNMYFS